MKDIISLSPSLAAGAIAARLVVFSKKRSHTSPPSGAWNLRPLAPPTRSRCPAGAA